MIYTFQKVNSSKRVIFYAKNKEEALEEIKLRYGREEYVLVVYTEVERFNLTIG